MIPIQICQVRFLMFLPVQEASAPTLTSLTELKSEAALKGTRASDKIKTLFTGRFINLRVT